MSSTFPEIIPALSTAVVNGATNVSESNDVNSRKGSIHGITTKSNGDVVDATIIDATTTTMTTTETIAEATSTYHCTFNDDDTKVEGNSSSTTVVASTPTQTRDDPQAENQSVSSLSVVSGSSTSDHNVKSQDNANGFVTTNGTTVTTATVTAAATKERKKRTNSAGNRLSRVFSISSATEKDNVENDASTISSITTTATTPQQEKRSKRRSFRLFSKGEQGKQEKLHVDTGIVNITSSGTTTVVVANPGVESVDEAPTATVTARPAPDPLTKSKNEKHRRSFTEMFNRNGSTLERSSSNVDEILRRRKKTVDQEAHEKKKRHSLNLAELLGFSDGYELSDSDSNEEEEKKESKDKQQRKKQQQQQQQQQQKKKKRHSLNLAELLGFSDDDGGAEDNDRKQRNKRLNVTEFLNFSDDGNKDGVTEIEKKRRNLNISDIIRYRHHHSKTGDSLEQVLSPVDFSAAASPTILNGRNPYPLENGGDAAVETTIAEVQRPKSPVGYEDSYYISAGVSIPVTSVADEQPYFPSGTDLLTKQENHISSETATSSRKQVNNTPLPPPIFTMPNSSLVTSETQQGSPSRSTNATSSNVFGTVICDSPQSPRWPQDWKQDVEKRILPVIEDIDNDQEEEEQEENEHGSTFVEGDIRKKLTELETVNTSLLNEKSKLEQEVQQQSEQIAKLSSIETEVVRQLEQTVRQLEQKINKQDDEVSGSLAAQRLEETIQRLEAKLDAQNVELGELREVVGDLRSTQSPITDKPNHITEKTTTQHHYRQPHHGTPDSSLDTTPPTTTTTTPTEQQEMSLITTSTSRALVNTTATLVDSLVVSPLKSSLFIASTVLYTVYVRPVVGIANILQQQNAQ